MEVVEGGSFDWRQCWRAKKWRDNRQLWIYWAPAGHSTWPSRGTSVEKRVKPTWRVWSERNLTEMDLIEQYHSMIPPMAWELRRDHRLGKEGELWRRITGIEAFKVIRQKIIKNVMNRTSFSLLQFSWNKSMNQSLSSPRGAFRKRTLEKACRTERLTVEFYL